MTSREPTFRARLRGMPTFPAGLPSFGVDLDDLTSAPGTPQDLFARWFDDAVAARIGAPHAATLSTADAGGKVDARMLVIKDVTAEGWWFAGQTNSPKGRDLAANPHAALTIFWRELGRQVRITGAATSAGPDAGAADFRARPEGSRAAGLVGRQSEVLPSRQEYQDAFAARLTEAREHPDRAAAGWSSWVLRPGAVEFWQASDDAGPTRLRYRRDENDTDPENETWTKELLWP